MNKFVKKNGRNLQLGGKRKTSQWPGKTKVLDHQNLINQ